MVLTSPLAQLIAALTAVAFGVVAALPSAIFSLPLKGFARVAADFLAVVVIALLFLLSCELGAKGQLTAYCAVCFLSALLLTRKFCAKPALAIIKAAKNKLRGAKRDRQNATKRDKV